MNSKIYTGKALLVEDDPFMRGAVAGFLADLGFEVCEVGAYLDAILHLDDDRQDFRIVVLDLSLPRSSGDDREPRAPLGLDIARRVKQTSTECGVVIWSAYTHFLPEVMKLISSGCKGLAYVPKGSRAQTLRDAFGRVMAGDVYIHSSVIAEQQAEVEERYLQALPRDVAEVVTSVADRLPELPPRLGSIAECITCTPTQIAKELNLEIKTVRNYQDTLYGLLGLKDPLTGAEHLRRDAIIVLAVLLQRLRQVEQMYG